MSTTAERRDATWVDMSRAEQWVVHHVMAAEIEARREDGEAPPWWATEVLRKLEDRPIESDAAASVRPFTCYEAWRMRRALASYAEAPDAPDCDAALADDLVRRLDETFVSPPAALQ